MLNVPQDFKNRIHQQFGREAKDFLDALSSETHTSIRLNPYKGNRVVGERIPWCSDGLYLDQRPSFTLDPLLHAGCYYVQEAASMFLEEIFNQLLLREEKLLVLDACAAPGGKSTHLASLLSHESLIVSNEVIASRVSMLKENIIKWGTGNVVITNNDPSSFSDLKGLFDMIVVDAPCSGEGLFRKDKGAVEEWSEENCNLCVSRQQRILDSLIPSIKSDGLLIYCTCTYNPAENEENVKWLVDEYDMECIPLNIPKEWGIKSIISQKLIAYGFYPHLTKSEGFFISVLRKRKEEKSTNIRVNQKKFQPVNNKFPFLKDWLRNNPENLFLVSDDIYLFPPNSVHQIEFLFQSLKVKYAGTHIATIKKNDLVPAHALALSIHFNKDFFPFLSLNYEGALKYLRKEDFKKEIKEKGWLLAKYGKTPLGWLKALDNRFNNYYPVEWRIRMR